MFRLSSDYLIPERFDLHCWEYIKEILIKIRLIKTVHLSPKTPHGLKRLGLESIQPWGRSV
jgi:hypothetical protein